MKNREEQLLDRLRQATHALRTTLDERDALARERTEPLAIVGIGCRLPGGASSPRAFWELLAAGRDAVVPLQERWARLGVEPDEQLPRWAALLTDPIDQFEPAFFGISPREARSMDPQQRLLLEVAWEALEDAGIPPLSLKQSRSGVFVAACTDDYATLVERQPASEKDAYATTGSMLSILAGRLSYTLGLQGPCFTIDTACSSSLVAIHLACRSLRSRESDLALAGGVNLILSLDSTTGLSRIQALSPDGRCRTFDALANGYVRGEGCGLLVLKRLSDAQRDGDRIWAVIRGSAINQDGRSTGLTAPNVLAQEALLREALRDAGLKPEAVGYIETHGTGTSLGDPIEVQALRSVLGKPRADGSRCVLGAVKTNIGHLEAAAGVAGVIKAALALAMEGIPKNLHLRTLNAHIELDGLSLTLANEPVPWPRGQHPRIAGVSGFGLSGTNVHVLLEEAPPTAATAERTARPAELILISGRTEAALRPQATQLQALLARQPAMPIADLAFSLATLRSPLEHRLALVAQTSAELMPLLDTVSKGSLPAGAQQGTASSRGKLAFLFTGQGAQLPGMGRGLYDVWPAFRAAFDRCVALFDPLLPRSLRDVIWAEPDSAQAALLDQTGYTQPALFALEYALCELWRSFGVQPDLVAGHSIGEIVAACVAGVFSLRDAVRLCAARAELMQALPSGGAMVSLAAREDEVEAALAPHRHAVSIAAINADDQIVLSGERDLVSQIAAEFSARGVRTKVLAVSHAFHSPQMDAMLASLRHVAESLHFERPQLALVSNLTGALVTNEVCRAEYWVQHARQAVRFAAGVRALQAAGARAFVEVGPRATLLSLVPRRAEQPVLLLPSLRGPQHEPACVLEALAGVWTQGGAIDPRGVFPTGGNRIELPTYPFQRQPCWVAEPDAASAALAESRDPQPAKRRGHPLLFETQRFSLHADARLWDTTLQSTQPAWIADHQIKGALVFPGAGHIEMALVAGREVFGAAPFAIADLDLVDALVLPENAPVSVQVETGRDAAGRVRFQVTSRATRSGTTSARLHSRAVLQRADSEATHAALDLSSLRSRLTAGPSAAEFYAALRAIGIELGPAFQGMHEIWQGRDEALGRLALPESAGSAAGYHFHPALLDACLQVMAGCFASPGETAPWVPVRLGSLRLFASAVPGNEIYCHAEITPAGAESQEQRQAHLRVTDGSGHVLAELRDFVVQRLDSEPHATQDEWFLAAAWDAAPVPPPKLAAMRCLLLGSAPTLAASLRAALVKAGHSVAHVPQLPASADAAREILGSAFQGSEPTAVLCLNDVDEGPRSPLEGPLPGALRRCEQVLYTVQAITALSYRDVPRLWLVTRGAQSVSGEDPAVEQAPLLGLGRTIALEHPTLRCTRLDLDRTPAADESAAILAELLADDAEEERALRAGQRWVSRLVRRPPKAPPAEHIEAAQGRPFRLELDKPSGFEHLTLRQHARRVPGPGEIEIAVEAAGLNFRDVLLSLGVIPEDTRSEARGPIPIGSECAGRVVAVGEGVQDLAPGDGVFALVRGAFASHVTCAAAATLPIPSGFTCAQAAAIPVAYLTAYYALHHVARLAPGESVLIHSASGAVGLAAIQWAQHVGATVCATAGSPDKRAFLASRGVRFVSDSRSDQFVADIWRWTQGHGVDVVLNSLSGERIEQSLSLLRDHGRFIELGKRDALQSRPLDLLPFLRNLSYSLLDLIGLLRNKPALVRAALQDIVSFFRSGVFSLPPISSAGIDHAKDAFRAMAQAQHIGKIVLTTPTGDPHIAVPTSTGVAIRSDGTYLVSGGLGGLGLGVASWLTQQGARELVLVSRTPPLHPQQEAAIAQLRQQGAHVRIASIDVADRAALTSLLRDLTDSGPPLRGVVHAAGVLADGVLLQQTAEQFERVLRPKVQGAWLLHELTQTEPLDFFVMYSSAAGLLGSPGQANYAAANAFLDALAYSRRARGLPAVSIDWGVFSQVGLAAQNANRAQRLELRGMRSIQPDEGLQRLRRVLGCDEAHVGVVPLNLRQWGAFHQAAAASPRFSGLRSGLGVDAASTGDRELLDRLRAAPPAKRASLIAEHLRTQVAHVLRIPPGELDESAPLTSLGLDSLMGLELRNHIESTLGIRVPATLLWTYPTIAALCQHMVAALFPASAEERADSGRSDGKTPAAPASAAEPAPAPDSDATTSSSDDRELFALLDGELALAKKHGA